MDSWRLILDGGHAAAHNMAVDEAMLAAYADGKAPPTIRLYYWATPAVSLGYSQDVRKSRIDLDYCEAVGISVVRRPTGGRAVLHGHDVTFSLVTDDSRIPKAFRGVVGSHLWIIQGVVRAFELLGIRACLGSSGSSRHAETAGGDCFAHIAECDVRWEHGKCAGAAQARKWGAILEQGSIPHAAPRVDCDRVFSRRVPMDTEVRFPLQDFSGKSVGDALVNGFSTALCIDLSEMGLTEWEQSLARRLAEEKYASMEWTVNRERPSVDNGMLNCYTDSAVVRGGRHYAPENPRG